jgi:hypothetical protein
MYSTIPSNWNIKSAPASPGRSRVGPAFYVFSFLGQDSQNRTGRKGQAGEDRQKRTGRRGLTKQNRQSRTARTGKLE